MKKKIGFTLIELLAVIVVIAIILLIAVPKVRYTIDIARLSSLESSAKMIAAEAEREYVKRTVLETLDQENEPITCADVTSLTTDYDNCDVTFDEDGVAYVSIYGKNKFEDMYCLNTTKDVERCNIEEDVYEESILNGAYPRLAEGMIPVVISNDGTVNTINSDSSDWYNYENKEWANVVLVKESGTHTRDYYATHYEVLVDESDIIAYLVWIPRYRYTLFNVEGIAAVYDGDTCTANCPESINITFENSDTEKSTGTTNGAELTHPAFTYNGVELNGIWVGKFETNQGTVSNVGIDNPTILPNITSWRSQNASTQFSKSLSLSINEVYGLSAESRMSLNSDWGAIAYLSHSQYGINSEIRINNNTNYITGCGASIVNGTATTSCEISYGTATSYPQSTTGNISGVFDMNGGSWEHQMGVYTDASTNRYSGRCNAYNSGYNGKYGDPSYTGCNSTLTEKADGKDYPAAKYYRLYKTTDWQSNTDFLGEALGEVDYWYKDSNAIVNAAMPWIIRGGGAADGSSTGIFSFNFMYGYAASTVSFRVIVLTS